MSPQVFTVRKGDRGKRLDRFLHEQIPGLSRARIQRVIRERVALSWGAEPRPSRPVLPGGEVVVSPRPRNETRLEIEVPVLARGPGWVAVDKPPGIPVHPVGNVVDNSLIRILRRQQGNPGLRLTHRLDRETSGVLLVAEDSPTASRLARAFESGEVGKEYLALVKGVPTEARGRIDLPIRPAARSRVFLRLETGEQGRAASTLWRVERRWAGRALLRIRLLTGRRHQIRVHLAAIGHPVLGDILYGRPDRDYLDLAAGRGDARSADGSPSRQMLHCSRLEFPDPSEPARRLAVSADLPADFRAWLV